MTISTIIPTCDRQDYLQQALESVLSQTVKPLEIIIVNNGKEQLQLPVELAAKAKIYNILPYAGAAQARNFGASVAAGDYLAFLDDDDLWEEKYLEKVSKALATGAECVISRLDELQDGQVSLYKNAHGKITFPNLFVYNPGVTGSNLVVSRKLFFAVSGFDPKLPPSEDKGLLIEILRRGHKVATLPSSQAIIRVHPHSRHSDDAARLAEGINQFTRKYGKLMTRKQLLRNWLKVYRYRYKGGSKKALLVYIPLYFLFRLMKFL